jgi:hypothetical protein
MRFNIRHPVFNDSDFDYWGANRVSSWPTIMVIGPENKPILKIAGEDNEDHIEAILWAGIEVYGDKLNKKPLDLKFE